MAKISEAEMYTFGMGVGARRCIESMGPEWEWIGEPINGYGTHWVRTRGQRTQHLEVQPRYGDTVRYRLTTEGVMNTLTYSLKEALEVADANA